MRSLVLLLLVVAGIASALSVAVAHAASLNVASGALTPYRTCALLAIPSTTTSVIDASVRQATATTNVGTATTNNVASSSGANRRLYLKFDLTACSPTIPSTAVIRTATLRNYLTAIPSAVCRTVDIFRVTATWAEGTITWNNQPFGATINNPASGTATDTFTVGTAAGCGNTSTGVYATGAVVTADVATFVAGTATNFGWMLRDDVEGSATAYTSTMSAKELATAAQAPELVVTYVLVP
jgi:hypothetical protein